MSELVDSETDLMHQKFAIAQSFYFKAFRCYYIAETYTSMKKWAEGVALLDRALEHTVEAIKHFQDWGQSDAEVSVAQIKSNYCFFIIQDSSY